MRIYQAELAEKILLSSEELEQDNYFKIGGKIMFNDLSVIKYINNINFIETQLPNTVYGSEFKNSFTDKITDNTDVLVCGLNKKEGKIKNPVLVLKSSPQEMAEGDFRDIVIFKNQECAFQDFQDSSKFTIYGKDTTQELLSKHNIDSYMLFKKLEHDFEENNKLIKEKKNKFNWRNA